jgi:hypothetical protein
MMIFLSLNEIELREKHGMFSHYRRELKRTKKSLKQPQNLSQLEHLVALNFGASALNKILNKKYTPHKYINRYRYHPYFKKGVRP